MKNNQHRPWGWTSADAAGLPIFPGLLRYDEVAAGAVNHAIRFTMQHTNLHRAQVRDRVNLECDMVGKYVVRAAELAGLTLSPVRPGEVTH